MDRWIRGLSQNGITRRDMVPEGRYTQKSMDSVQNCIRKRIPDVGRVEKTAQDLERELLAMTDSLGKTERYANDDVWTHVAFAQRALDLA